MIDYLKSKLEHLVTSLLDPLWNSVIKGSWKIRSAALVFIASAGAIYTQPKIAADIFGFVEGGIRVVASETGNIPVAIETIKVVSEAQGRLRLSVENDAAQLSAGYITPWSAAQTAKALVGSRSGLRYAAPIASFIRENSAHECGCWSELPPHERRSAWLFISGWVFSALSDYKIPATIQEVTFILSMQNKDGSWPSVANNVTTQYASTYSTAWIIKGLHEQLTMALFKDAEHVTAVGSSIQRGAAWLLSVRQSKARWKLYPNLTTSSASGSVSGLVLHSLHLTIPNDLALIDKEWIDNLPETPPPANVGDNTYIEIRHGDGTQIDHFVQLTMPWMLIATVDSFESGTLIQKIRALSWIEKTVTHQSVPNADAEQNNWWRAELLHSINYLFAHISPTGSVHDAQPGAQADRPASGRPAA